MEIRRLASGEVDAVVAASELFDDPARDRHAARFLDSAGHHLLIAYEGGLPVGFVSGVEMTHPDKGTEMFLYELGVLEPFRRRGVGSSLVAALRELATEHGCYDMWVLTEADNAAAVATYEGTGATDRSAHVMLTWDLRPAAGPPGDTS